MEVDNRCIVHIIFAKGNTNNIKIATNKQLHDETYPFKLNVLTLLSIVIFMKSHHQFFSITAQLQLLAFSYQNTYRKIKLCVCWLRIFADFVFSTLSEVIYYTKEYKLSCQHNFEVCCHHLQTIFIIRETFFAYIYCSEVLS